MDYRLPNSFDKTLKKYPDGDFHNYDDTEDNYSIDIGLRYGDMPSEMLMQKFDVTNIDSDTYQPLESLDDHWRSTLQDLSAQPTSLESDYRRTDTQSASFLNWRYHGTRGDSDVEVHQPEMFLGFHGEEDREPRGGCKGTNPLEPDMKEFTKQNQARLKYLRFTPDASLNVTGLGRSEAKAEADNQTLFRTIRHQLNWFDTSFDGRRNGMAMNGGINPESLVYQQTGLEENYNDYIKQAQMDRRNKTTILSNKIIRDSPAYQQFTTDHRFQVAAYGENPRRFRPYFPMESKIVQVDTENELAYPEEKVDGKLGKTANLLMGQIILQRQKAESDLINKDSNQELLISKTKRQEQEIKSVINNLINDTTRHESTESARNGKTKARADHVSAVTVTNEDQDKHTSNVTMMYKTLTGSKDVVKSKHFQQTDQDVANALGIPVSKSAKLSRTRNALNNTQNMTDNGVSLETVKYKTSSRKQLKAKQANLDGTEAPDFQLDAYGKAARRAANISRADDVVVQDGHNELMKDSVRVRSHVNSKREHGAAKNKSEHTIKNEL